MRRKSSGDLSSASPTSGSSDGTRAKAATSPYEMRRPLEACTTTPGSVVSSPAGMLHSRATLSSSTRRIRAPASRRFVKYPRTAMLPTVIIVPPDPRPPQLRP